MIDLDDYKAYYQEDLTEPFDEMESAKLEGSTLTPEELSSFVVWMPKTNGVDTIQVVREGDVLKQNVSDSWSLLMRQAINHLVMTPDEQIPHTVINTNVDAVRDIPFQVDGGGIWRIVEWRTNVTKSKEQPFKRTNTFPVEGAGNLLCDEVTFKLEGSDRFVVMRYGWEAYID